MKTLRSLLIAAFLMVPFSAFAGEREPLTVVELFTSQGCSSCPAAEAFLGELAERDDVLALSMHVDYWDYIGWKDSFADPKHTDRQRAYAERFHLRSIYTPQMVIDGVAQAVGSDRAAVDRLIAHHHRPVQVWVTAVAADDGGITVTLPKTRLPSPAAVWVATFDPKHVTEVRRGENAGRRLVETNVVRGMRTVRRWSGDPVRFSIAPGQMAGGGRDGAVVVQIPDGGPVLGAARVVLTR